jgi:OOP family OmpA-OmpF porin
MKPMNKIPLAVLMASIIWPLTSPAQDVPGGANWKLTGVNQYWKNSTGQCWRSSTWTPAEATPECDPELFKKAEAPQPRVVSQKVSFSSEDLFNFNEVQLTDTGKEKLDRLANELKDAKYDTITATGHADRLGSKSYNKKLSEERAESVRAYLVSKGIPADRIHAEGKGESEPVTSADQCKDVKGAELTSCLKADRRVEVEVNATKDVIVRPAS